MRLKSELWVRAYLRRCTAAGAAGVLERRGDGERGAILIKVSRLDGTASLYAPAPAGRDGGEDERRWQAIAERREVEVDALIARQVAFDPDAWVVAVEDREGRHFLDDWLFAERA